MKKFNVLVLVPLFVFFMHSSAFAGVSFGFGVSTGPLSFSYQDDGLYDDFGSRLQFVGRSHSGHRPSGHGYRGHSGRKHSGHGYRGHSGHRYSRQGHGRHHGHFGRSQRHYGYSGLHLGLGLVFPFWPFLGLGYDYPYGYSYPYNYPYYGGGYYSPGYNTPPPGYYGPQQNYGVYDGSTFHSSRENYTGEHDFRTYHEKRAEELGSAKYDFRTYHEKRAAEIEKRRELSLQSDQEN